MTTHCTPSVDAFNHSDTRNGDRCPEQEKHHVIMIGTERSGSSLLMELIHQRTLATVDMDSREPLNQKRLRSLKLQRSTKQEKLGHAVSTINELNGHAISTINGLNGRVQVVVKILLSQLHDSDLRVIDLIKCYPRCRFIILTRNNILETYVNLRIALKNKVWYSSRNQNNESIRLDVDQFTEYVREQEVWWAKVMEDLTYVSGVNNIMCVTYEGIVANMPQTVTHIYRFLGLEPSDLAIRVNCVRQNPRPLHQKIVNYDDVREQVEDIIEHCTIPRFPHGSYV